MFRSLKASRACVAAAGATVFFGPVALAQEAKPQSTPLPPVVVEQSALPAPAKKAKKKVAAKTKPAQSAGASAPAGGVSTPGAASAASPASAAAKLATPNTTGSLLGLTPAETPATVNIVTQKDMQDKGARSLIEAYRTVPGVLSGNLPGEPGVTSIRGFSRGATGYSVDGFRAVDPLMISRDYDSFNFDRVEILKGPASVVSGTGALAGTINLVTRQATLGKTEVEGMTSYGSFGTVRAGASVNAPISPDAAFRSTISYSRGNGYVDDTDFEKVGFTNNVVLKPSSDLTLTGSVDYFHDDFSTPYQGIPLIPASVAREPTGLVSTPNGFVVDKSLRKTNYNVDDGRMKSDALWLRSKADYKLSRNWSFKNELGYYTADRYWGNSEDFTYNTGTGKLDRSTTLITHDHQFWSDRAYVAYDGPVGPVRDRFTAGYEYIDTQFGSVRRFGTATSVDPFAPVRGTFSTDNATTRQDFDSSVETSAVFAENAVNLTRDLLVLGGIRYEETSLDRQVNDLVKGATTSFGRKFDATTWRLGATYEVVKGTTLYGQYTEAVIPITTLLLSNLANSKFELSTGQSFEAGIKSIWLGGSLVTTAAAYQIDQDNILTRDPVTPSLTVQGGSQRSRGIEVDASLALTNRWNVYAAAAVIDAEYTSLRNATGDLTGNRPVNVPPYTLYLSTDYRLEDFPATIGASLYSVGDFYTDTANTILVGERTLLDAWIAYDVGVGTVRLRGRNLTDEFYADWSGYSSTQVYLGAPRSFDVTYSAKW